MGLRINSSVNTMMAISNLRRTGILQSRALERLSTGLRINRASDDPGGMVISERLRGQIAGLSQAIENSQTASNLINTADAALGEIKNLLHEVRESILASIGADPEVIAAEQDTVNNVMTSIDRIASTTRYGNKPLLNGTAGFTISARDAGLTELEPRQIQFAGASQLTFSVSVSQIASQATLAVAGAGGDEVAGGGPVTLEIRGPLGVETITLASGATRDDMYNAVNTMRGNTGVYGSGTNLYTEDYGSNAAISVTQTGGGGGYTGDVGSDKGVNMVATVNGVRSTGNGRTLTMSSSIMTADITVGTSVANGVTLSFTVDKSGLNFQLGGSTRPSDTLTIGIQSMTTSNLGEPTATVGGETFGGYLNSLRSGSANDLFTNPENALRIVDAALSDVNDLSADLGAVEAYTIQPNINSLEVGMQQLTQSLSQIRDADYAMEISNFIRTQILMQAGIAVLSQANSSPSLVLDLLNASGLGVN